MTLSKLPSQLGSLRARLERSRARARNNLLLRALVGSVLAAGVSYLVSFSAQLLWRGWFGEAWAWGALVFTATLAAGIWQSVRKTPSLLELAQQADQRFSLYERSSTALEIALNPHLGTHAGLAAAVLEDAAHHAPRIEPRTLVPFHLPRMIWWLVPLCLLIGVVQLGSSRLTDPRFTDPRFVEPQTMTPEARKATATSLRQTAALLREEGEAQSDPYLQALAQAFERLSGDLETGELSDAETLAELNRLMSHLDRAYADSLGDARAPNPGVEAQDPSLGAGEEQASVEEPPLASNRVADEGSPDLGGLLSQLEQVGQELQAAKASREANEGRVTRADMEKYGPYITPEALEALKRLEEQEQQSQTQRAGQPVGAAEESTRGAGDLAGEGSQPLTEEGATPDFRNLGEASEDLLLPEIEESSEDTVQLELPPATQATQVTDTQETQAASWQARREAELRRDLLLPRDRAVVSRYFERPEEGTSITQ